MTLANKAFSTGRFALQLLLELIFVRGTIILSFGVILSLYFGISFREVAIFSDHLRDVTFWYRLAYLLNPVQFLICRAFFWNAHSVTQIRNWVFAEGLTALLLLILYSFHHQSFRELTMFGVAAISMSFTLVHAIGIHYWSQRKSAGK